ncbi:hypothetical protein [Marinobacter sp. AN1]|uniref:hypothetical protein n=1 Tax=Marinobacter sp. AN1 TaxID=2886046 RepID=UPI00222F07E7|nr:hypothetical protein [Marinobacter sp. AN1]UZD66728.1 hypothetical protein LJ360_05115 [Marinobacter sp. AN1]
MNGSFAILAVAIATSGYILASKCLLNRYRVARQSGHRLYLSSLKYGIYAHFPALFLAWIFSLAIPPLNTPITTAILTILSALTFTEVYNRKPSSHQWIQLKSLLGQIREQPLAHSYKKLKEIFPIDEERRSVALWEAWQENDIELICAYAVGEFKPVAVTLESKKVYVGIVADTIEPSDQDSYLSILPLYSGYRDDSQAFKLNHKYVTLIEALLGEGKELSGTTLDYAIAIPLERIVTIHIFNEDLYQEVSGRSTENIIDSPDKPE